MAKKPFEEQIALISLVFLTVSYFKQEILSLNSRNVKKCENHLLFLEH